MDARYITSLFNETDGDLDDHPVDLFVRPLLETEGLAEQEIEGICSELQQIWDKQTGTSQASGPAKLDRALDMRAAEMLSKKQAITQVVDIASVVKARDTQVNLKALEKAEAKIRAKMEKRDRKNAYEGSKLMDAAKAQKSYEELFLEVNPLQLASQNKGKSKDIHLENIDVNFGSLRILSNATVTLAEGRYATRDRELPRSPAQLADILSTSLQALRTHRTQRNRKVDSAARDGPARG